MEPLFAGVDAMLTFAIFALSLNLLQGYAGQVSLAHAAFGGIGGYVLAYLVLYEHGTTLEATAAGVVAAGIAGVLIGLPALRQPTEWLILLSLATQTIVVLFFVATHALGGSYGLHDVTDLTLAGVRLDAPSTLVAPYALCTAVVFAICHRIGESPCGRVLRGIREDETACRALGKDVVGYKLAVFGISSAMAGLAGALVVVDNQGSSPSQFSFAVSSAIVAIVVIGGSGNLWGTLVGVLAFSAIAPLVQLALSVNHDIALTWSGIGFGAALVAVVMLRPAGIVPESSERRARRILARLRARDGTATR